MSSPLSSSSKRRRASEIADTLAAIRWVLDDALEARLAESLRGGRDRRGEPRRGEQGGAQPLSPTAWASALADRLPSSQGHMADAIGAHSYLSLSECLARWLLDHALPLWALGLGACPVGDLRRSESGALLGDQRKHVRLFAHARLSLARALPRSPGAVSPVSLSRLAEALPPLSQALFALHIEWAAEAHAVEAETSSPHARLTPLCRLHWREGAQMARLHTLAIEGLRARLTERAAMQALRGYFQLCAGLAETVDRQVRFDLAALLPLGGAPPSEEAALMDAHGRAQRWRFVGTGLTHARVLAVIERLAPSALAEAELFGADFIDG